MFGRALPIQKVLKPEQRMMGEGVIGGALSRRAHWSECVFVRSIAGPIPGAVHRKYPFIQWWIILELLPGARPCSRC